MTLPPKLDTDIDTSNTNLIDTHDLSY
jgi:hypothetical protein